MKGSVRAYVCLEERNFCVEYHMEQEDFGSCAIVVTSVDEENGNEEARLDCKGMSEEETSNLLEKLARNGVTPMTVCDIGHDLKN